MALRSAKHVVLSSASALTDDQLRSDVIAVAQHHGSCLVLSTGAAAGMDAVSAASRLQLDEVLHRIVRSPKSWPTTADAVASLEVGRTVLFRGSARDGHRCSRARGESFYENGRGMHRQ